MAALPVGSKIEIEFAGVPKQKERLVRVERERLIVAPQRVIERADIRRITRKSRLRGALIGLAAGFAVGFPVGAAAGPYIADHGFPSAAKRAQFGLGWGMFSAGIGAGIGALTGSRQTLYP
ncbi:MAG: hypothetical protein IT162_05435 [Bryobacterales bacterium]|nr:hypothetical protein [Bryobacterales bacterium]